MGNIFKSKGLVTIVSAIFCIGLLFFAYRMRVNKEINAINIPVAAKTLEGRTEITKDMIKTIKVASSLITNNVIRNESNIIGKFVNYNTFVPEGSLFYTSSIVTWDQMPDSAWSNINANNTIVSLPVNAASTYGNSIYPGDKIDLYYKSYDEKGKLIYGKLIEGIEVLAVKDSSGNHIFKKSADQQDAAALIFQVDENSHLLLKSASFISGSQIIPVPRNSSYNPETTISSKFLEELITNKCEILTPDEIADESGNINITE